MSTVPVFATHEKWLQILDELAEVGPCFYQMYGDVEDVVLEHEDGDEDAWAEFAMIIAKVYN